MDEPLRPAAFCQQLLHSLDASEGRRKRRKRDTTPDRIGLDVKRDLLQQVVADDPAPDDFEAWLLTRVLALATGGGPVRALAMQILDEYRVAAQDPHFRSWLAEGAPSADANSEL